MLTSSTELLHSSSDFNILTYGATGEGLLKESIAIQAAIDACHAAGGGRVVVPPGDYCIAPLYLRSNVNLHLMKGASLLGSEEISDYAEWRSHRINTDFAPYNARYLLIAEGEENISITGEGRIDGRGAVHYEKDDENPNEKWWKIHDRSTRPGRMIWLIHCRNVRIESATFCGSPAWTFWLVACRNVRISDIHIEADWKALNTDGIDIDSCSDVVISHSRFVTGDDCIVLRAIRNLHADPMPCERVHVENCDLKSNCNAVRFAYLRDGTIRNISMKNLTIRESRRGVICQIPDPGQTPEKDFHIPLGEGPLVENLLFENLHIEAIQPLWFYLSDAGRAQGVSNVTFRNATLIGSTPSYFKGTEATPFQNIELTNIRFQTRCSPERFLPATATEVKANALMAKHCDNLSLTHVMFEGPDSGLPMVSFEECRNCTGNAEDSEKRQG